MRINRPVFRGMRDVGKNLEIPLFVFGPETHMTAIVGMALEKRNVPNEVEPAESATANFLLPGSVNLFCSLFSQYFYKNAIKDLKI